MRFRPGAAGCRALLVLGCGHAALSALAFALQFPALAAVPLGIVAYRRIMRWNGSGDAFGTARASDYGDLLRHGQIGTEGGLILGTTAYTALPSKAEALAALFNPATPSDPACRQFFGTWLGSRLAGEALIRIKDYVHLGTFAPAGAGKGVGVLVVNLRSHPGSCVVPDVKGELFTLTAEHRRRKFGHQIVRLDPFAVCGPSADALNPLDFLPPASDPSFLDACRDLANMLVVRKGTEHDPHWDDSAERVLTAFIAFVAACERDPAQRNLLGVRTLLASRDAYLATVAVMQQVAGFDGVIQRLGGSLTWLAEKELNSVLSVTHRHTSWMDSPAVSACLARSTFDPRQLRGRMTLYPILPPERLVTLAPLMRVWLGTTLRALTRGPASEKNPVLFFVDEAAHLGRMQVLEDAITLMRGYGIRIWLFFQSIAQVRTVYGDHAQVLLDNLGTQQFFGTHDYESAEHESKRIGEYTRQITSYNDTRGYSHPTGTGREPQPGSASTSSSVTISEQARRLFKPEEILTLPANLARVYHKNQPVILAKLHKYFEAPEFRRGGTGKGRGLGLEGVVMAASVLLLSLTLSAIVARLPVPVLRPAPPRHAIGQPRPAFRRAPLRRPHEPWLPGRSGTLIRIPDPAPTPGGPP